MEELCHFCSRRLIEVGRAVDNHHLVARRYFKKGEDHRRNNLVRVCTDCHRSWHRTYDSPRYSITEYLDLMSQLDWGRGIFA